MVNTRDFCLPKIGKRSFVDTLTRRVDDDGIIGELCGGDIRPFGIGNGMEKATAHAVFFRNDPVKILLRRDKCPFVVLHQVNLGRFIR